ncbi:MAG: hypothetical protein H0U47_10930, partial [Nocardioidaceae bacterium]|nr:hypothetical protein [Nocardioidaceae bacterium]
MRGLVSATYAASRAPAPAGRPAGGSASSSRAGRGSTVATSTFSLAGPRCALSLRPPAEHPAGTQSAVCRSNARLAARAEPSPTWRVPTGPIPPLSGVSSVTFSQSATSTTTSAEAFGWSDLDRRAVDTVRALAMDAVQKVGNGHPGTAMSLAPLAYLLYQQMMRHDPNDPQWPGRDRFVLSAGHSSLTQYIQLYLSGYGLGLEDLQALRTWGSKTPAHPEVNHTPGIEITTGPLGQGLASAAGMAAAARRERGLLDPDTPAGQSPFDHTIWVIASDGDIQEGITSEASSWAGHQQLGNLVVVYDANHISIEDDTDVAMSEDTAKRYEAYGWHVQTVDWTGGKGSEAGADDSYDEDVEALHAALTAAREERGRPSFVVLRTIIAWPAPKARNTGKAHGSALGDDEVRATKQVMGMDPDATFAVADEVLDHARQVAERGKAA